MSDSYADLRAILNSHLDRAAKASAVAEALRRARGYHWVGLYDVTATHIRAVAWTGVVAPAFPTFPRSQGLNGAAVASRQALIVQDVAKDPRWLTTFSTSKAEAIFPVTVNGAIVGTIDVESDRVGAFTRSDEDFLQGAAVVLQPLWADQDDRVLSLPQLTDGRILLRPHRAEDCEALHAAVTESTQEVSAWLQWCHAGYTREEAESFIKLASEAWAHHAHYPFAILAVEDGAFLGGVGINHIVMQNRLANVGYWVRTSHTRQGIATAALELVAQYAFGALGLTRLEVVCIPTNASSRRVAEKVGAKFEALSRNRIVMHGVAHDAALYGLVPADLQPGNHWNGGP